MFYLVIGLIVLGLIFAIAGVVGMLRMPDTYCRMHSAAIITSIVIIFVLAGAIIYAAAFIKSADMVVKLAVMLVFYIVTSPIASRALAKGVYREGYKLTKKHACDQYGEDMEEC